MQNNLNQLVEDTLQNEDHTEGTVAKTIEEQTAKLPSDLFLWSSIASMGISCIFKMMGKKDTALFIGQWSAPFLLLGIYNKIVKVAGHDKQDTGSPDNGQNKEMD